MLPILVVLIVVGASFVCTGLYVLCQCCQKKIQEIIVKEDGSIVRVY